MDSTTSTLELETKRKTLPSSSSSMEVKLLDYMGSDASVVDAARVSFNKKTTLGTHSDGSTFLLPKDEKLINYLANHGHWSPFTHAFLSFRVKAPIFVARQLWKSHVGVNGGDQGDGWNEVSRRYISTPPEFYFPEEWRQASSNKKQGSEDEPAKTDWVVDSGMGYDFSFSLPEWFEAHCSEARQVYEEAIAYGVCPEQARMLLPQNTMTEWIWSGSVLFFSRVCNLRIKPDAQRETQFIAREISNQASELFPVSWKALTDD